MKKRILLSTIFVFAFCLVGALSLCRDSAAVVDGTKVYILGDQPKYIGGLLSPGETYHDTIDIENNNDEVATISLEPRPLSYVPMDGDYVPDYRTQTAHSALSKWINFPEGLQYDIAPGETIAIGYEFTVPKDAVSGTQSTAVLIHAATKGEKESGSGVSAEISFGYTIHINIDGADLKKEGEVVSWEATGFTFSPPLRLSSVIENTGNMSFKMTHDLAIYDLFNSKDPVFTDSTKSEVLPASKRAVFEYWNEAPQLGIFNIKETISFLDKSYEYSKTIIVCPLWLIILVLAFLASLIVLIVQRSRASKKKSMI